MKRTLKGVLAHNYNMTFIQVGIGHGMAPLQILYYMTVTLKLKVETYLHHSDGGFIIIISPLDVELI